MIWTYTIKSSRGEVLATGIPFPARLERAALLADSRDDIVQVVPDDDLHGPCQKIRPPVWEAVGNWIDARADLRLAEKRVRLMLQAQGLTEEQADARFAQIVARMSP